MCTSMCELQIYRRFSFTTVMRFTWCKRHQLVDLIRCKGISILCIYTPGPRFNIKMTSYQYRKSHCGDKTIRRPSYLHNGISYTGKMTSLYWIRSQLPLPNEGIPGFMILFIWCWSSWYFRCTRKINTIQYIITVNMKYISQQCLSVCCPNQLRWFC